MNSSPLAGSTDQTLVGARPANRELRFSRIASLWTLYVLTLRQHLHGKRWVVMAGLFALCAGLVILVRATTREAPPVALEFFFVFLLIPQAVLPLLALVYASGIVRDEQEEQTITYLLIRPIPKWAIYLIKLLATVTTAVVLTTALTTVLYAAIYIKADAAVENVPMRCAQAAGIHALAVITYCCLFGLFSLVTKQALLTGIVYAIFFEGLLANLPFSVRLATVIYYARLIAYRSMKFVTAMPGRSYDTTDLAAEFWRLDIQNDPGLLEHPQIRTCLMVLLAASLVCALVAAIVFSQREFHVKTPEKA